jgi:2-acylglycerol O-acyltransferase 2
MAASNPEPSVPEEREKQHLPPKSYADAAVEPPAPIDRETHENGEANGNQNEDGGKANGYNPPQSSTRQKAAVLRIVAPDDRGEYKSGEKEHEENKSGEKKSEEDKSEESKSDENNKSEGKLSRPDLGRGVSKQEYTATVTLAFLIVWYIVRHCANTR